MSTSFSPAFENIAVYGKKQVPPQNHHHEPYAKRADPDGQPNAKTLSPAVRSNSWIISPQTSMKNIAQAKKDENKRRKSVLEAALPIARKVQRTFQLMVSSSSSSSTEENSSSSNPQPTTNIQVLQEDDNEDEEEKLPPTPVASFLVQENTGDEKFPWAIVNAETGLEVAFYKHKSTDFASHLEDGEKMRKQRQLELELFGKTPLYESQKYRKKAADNPEIIYHWASIKVRYASNKMGMLLGLFFATSESIEMSTKHETPQEFKLVKHQQDESGGKGGGFTILSKKKEVAIGEVMEDGNKLRLTVKPKVDPTLIIIFLSMTGNLAPSTQ